MDIVGAEVDGLQGMMVEAVGVEEKLAQSLDILPSLFILFALLQHFGFHLRLP